MMNSSELNDKNAFLEAFMDEYLYRGLGTLQKRDVEILFVHLLLQDRTFGNNIDYYKMSHALGISESKVRRLIYDSQLRYQSYSEDMAKEEFLDLMMNGSFFVDKYHRINFMIRKPILRQYFEEWVSRFSGMVDSSFNASCVKVSLEDFSQVLAGLALHENTEAILKRNLDQPQEGLSTAKYIKQFLKKFFTDPECSIEYGALVLKQIILN